MAKRGRPPKYRDEYIEQAYKVCAQFGADDKKLAAFFGVAEPTINLWKEKHPGFIESIKKGKDEYDTANVEVSLLKRAEGYRYTEVTEEATEAIDEETGKAKMVLTKRVHKEMAPETAACCFWLKNRHPDRWSDRHQHEHEVKNLADIMRAVHGGNGKSNTG